MTTDTTKFLQDLDGGVFEQKLAHVLSEAAASAIDHDKESTVTIKLKLKRIGTSYQVAVTHQLAFSMPTDRGKKTEEDTTETPMYVGTGGKVTLFLEGQSQLFDRNGKPAIQKETTNNE